DPEHGSTGLEPEVTVDDVPQLILTQVCVKRRALLRADQELQDRERAIGLLGDCLDSDDVTCRSLQRGALTGLHGKRCNEMFGHDPPSPGRRLGRSCGPATSWRPARQAAGMARLGRARVRAPGCFLYVSMVCLLPPADVACCSSSAEERRCPRRCLRREKEAKMTPAGGWVRVSGQGRR